MRSTGDTSNIGGSSVYVVYFPVNGTCKYWSTDCCWPHHQQDGCYIDTIAFFGDLLATSSPRSMSAK